ncbi:hypothetical protein Patl1_12059 [Pistacia atlantica]|nr:hypothetical protein Patl1_12059 [Pistacia atlantica]
MVSLSLAFGTLFGWHVFLISKNMTTIEVSLEILKLYTQHSYFFG